MNRDEKIEALWKALFLTLKEVTYTAQGSPQLKDECHKLAVVIIDIFGENKT